MSSEVKKEVQLEIAHVLFTDIVGYSKRLISEQRALRDTLIQIVRNTDEFQSAEAAGRLLKIPTGDGMALVFYNSPEEPAECALEISRALQEHPALKLRMGVHSGPVSGVVDVNEQAGVAGAAINIAQRVMDCGDAGHILLSKHVADDLEHFPQWSPHLHDLGECEVKHGLRISVVNLYTEELGNPEEPAKFRQAKEAQRARAKPTGPLRLTIAALVIAAVAAGSYLLFHRSKAPPSSTFPSLSEIPLKSIAVLPFQNLSEDKANAYFADGIQDEILTRLSKIADLKVISRTSTLNYKSTPENLPEIARQLGVAHILEGSVQKSGAAVRVNVQLIKAATDSHLWADTFDRKLTDIFLVESDVAKAIAEQLRAHLSGREEQDIAAKPTDNPAAYDAYLRGLAYSLKTGNTSANALGAQKYLREATRLDPKFALAWALLSYVNSLGYITLTLQPTDTLREEVRQAAETALTLQPNLGEAVMAKGYYYYSCLRDNDTALRYFEQARPLLPNSSRVPESLAYVARRRGQWEKSEAYFNDAERLDPRSVNLLTQHALSYTDMRRFPEALHKFDQVLNITPDDLDTLVCKAAIAQAEGDLKSAAAILAPLRPAVDDSSALETQFYQAMLERRPASIIPQIKEILARPDPALGYFTGELRFWLGWAQDASGDPVAARKTWQDARRELDSFLKEQPDNYSVLGDLALTAAGLGDKAAALALVEQAMVANPIEKDALAGPVAVEVLARVAARVGEPDRAIAALQKLLSMPCEGALASTVPITPALLQLDPMFDPLRKDAPFKKLVAARSPKGTKP